MKKLTLSLLFFLFAYITFAQINVGTNFQITGQIPIDKRMGEGHPWHPSKKQVAFFPDYHIYEYNQTSLYRISTQFSVWNTEYLLYHLKQRFSPWDFELEGSRIAMNDGKQIIASSPKYALHWVHSGLSGKYPDKVNVVGIKREDVEEMISKGLLQRDKLQLGIEHNSPLYK